MNSLHDRLIIIPNGIKAKSEKILLELDIPTRGVIAPEKATGLLLPTAICFQSHSLPQLCPRGYVG